VASDLVFTDDRAPVEFIADSLVLRFALEGGSAQAASKRETARIDGTLGCNILLLAAIVQFFLSLEL
jgi:hypothetical protein